MLKGIYKRKNKKTIEKECGTCGKIFYVSPSLDRLQYCCWDCYTKSQTRKDNMKKIRQTGHNKGKIMINTAIRMILDNPMFKEEYKMYGEKNPMWRGGTSFELYGQEWPNIRLLVLERDCYKCQTCGKTHHDDVLNIHHIIPFRISQDNSLTNLITLCRSCHSKITFGIEVQLIREHINLNGGT